MDKDIQKLEMQIYKMKSKLATMRKKGSLIEIKDYVLQNSKGKDVRLSELFGKSSEMILVHNMGTSCPYCTLWADGFSGLGKHIENRAAFVLESKDSIKVQKAFAKARDWNFTMVSSQNSTLKRDLGFEKKDGMFQPGISGLLKKGQKIFQYSRTILGPGDNYCVAWDLMDLAPNGAGKWNPKFKY